MRVSFETRGGFDNTERWLKDIANNNMSSQLKQIADKGVRSLSSHTPKNTGETANSWKADIHTRGEVSEVVWTNTAHPETNVNLAKLIDLGYSTGTGGYVPPRPYIKNAMKPVWLDVDRMISKELNK